MVHRLHELGVKIETDIAVRDLLIQDGHIGGIRTSAGAAVKADAVIVCVGGASYPGTGSTGDGYAMAASVGHTIVPIRPSLVPLETEEEWVKDVQGLSLRNIRGTLLVNGEKFRSCLGRCCLRISA